MVRIARDRVLRHIPAGFSNLSNGRHAHRLAVRQVRESFPASSCIETLRSPHRVETFSEIAGLKDQETVLNSCVVAQIRQAENESANVGNCQIRSQRHSHISPRAFARRRTSLAHLDACPGMTPTLANICASCVRSDPSQLSFRTHPDSGEFGSDFRVGSQKATPDDFQRSRRRSTEC